MLDDRLLELRIGQILQLGVEGKHGVFTLLRHLDRFDVLDDLAAPILDDAPAAWLARQLGFHGQFDAFLANILGAGKAQHVGRYFTGRVIAAKFVLEINARELKVRNLRSHIRGDLALDIHKVTRARQFAPQFACIHLKQAGQFACLCGGQFGVLGNCPDRFHRCRHRQHVAMTIKNSAACRRDFDDALVARLTFADQKILVYPLQIKRAGHQRR